MVRIGIFGAGAMARKHIETYRRLRGARLAGVSWAREKNLRLLEKEYAVPAVPDIDALLESSDAVDICLPTPLHEEAVLRAAAAGRHVLCEKPIALDLAAADRMIAACRRAGVVFMIAHCLRFWPEYVFLNRAVDQAKFGRLLQLELERFSSIPSWGSGGWLTDAARSGGPTVDLHIHDADMAIFLLGPPLAVRAEELITATCMSVEAAYDYGGDGPLVRARGGWILDAGYPFHAAFRAVFERAVLEYDSRLSPTLTIFRPNTKPRAPKLPPHDGYYYQLEQFIRCAASGVEPPTATAANGREALALTLAERKAAKKKIVVKFFG